MVQQDQSSDREQGEGEEMQMLGGVVPQILGADRQAVFVWLGGTNEGACFKTSTGHMGKSFQVNSVTSWFGRGSMSFDECDLSLGCLILDLTSFAACGVRLGLDLDPWRSTCDLWLAICDLRLAICDLS